jgi:hypothetical protein
MSANSKFAPPGRKKMFARSEIGSPAARLAGETFGRGRARGRETGAQRAASETFRYGPGAGYEDPRTTGTRAQQGILGRHRPLESGGPRAAIGAEAGGPCSGHG